MIGSFFDLRRRIRQKYCFGTKTIIGNRPNCHFICANINGLSVFVPDAEAGISCGVSANVLQVLGVCRLNQPERERSTRKKRADLKKMVIDFDLNIC